ncbi:MAG: FAD-binding oxidoreductase [Timaviella obliquedivisa GSE-PSE-MK23-08B]|jgi:glycine/D-amino acid oxidase-like deaminating enzyme|nr:FAD-binding oxidoreductase [Timaviella obliquedivisa GSE-PSE-MK23-08B]
MSRNIVVIGCGIVGAAIAYELSRIPNFAITVLDQSLPAQGATGDALGVLMGIISQKVKGRAWNLRQTSIRRYATLIPELEVVNGQKIPWNPQGILRLCFAGEDWFRWETLIETRHAQGWCLERWNEAELNAVCPYLNPLHLTGAIYSPQDLQIDPAALTLALVAAAQKNGVTFRFNTKVESLEGAPICRQVQTQIGSISADWIVVSSGLGSTALTHAAAQPLEILPVLGQALRLKISQSTPPFHPAINGNDIHIVPLGQGEYWIGATVEFPDPAGELVAEEGLLQKVLEGAIALYPALAHSTILQTWAGLRPRPHNRPAPIIEPMSGYGNVFLATGHYRNGVLLSPATALMVRDAACEFFGISNLLN